MWRVYETEDRNYLLVLAAVIDKVITMKSETMRKAQQTNG